ncbi:GIY-YIG nuclease family protein [Agrobacterium deltaense]
MKNIDKSANDLLNIESLYSIGFRSAAKWAISEGSLIYKFDTETEAELRPSFDVSNALYAFCRNDEVLYIGKTTQSLRKRLVGYCTPGQSQGTNKRCHRKIKTCLDAGDDIAILIFTPIDQLQYAHFTINLAAGLEDSLILRFDPPWNGVRKGRIISESAEMEEILEIPTSAASNAPLKEIGTFSIGLAPTYYNLGFVNPGVVASQLLGAHNETLVVRFSDSTPSIATRIDRHANANGAVRFIGNNQAISDWFQKNFRLNDIVTVKILGTNEVQFLKP